MCLPLCRLQYGINNFRKKTIGKINLMVERSQVWFPNDLSRTIYLCTWPLFLLQWKVKNKCLPWYYHSLYTGQRKYILWLYYPEFLELGTGTCRASASSMLREGDWSHVQDTTEGVKKFLGDMSPKLWPSPLSLLGDNICTYIIWFCTQSIGGNPEL